MTWKSQIATGRVFELRSSSKRFPAPCGLIIDADATGGSWRCDFMTPVDQFGCLGDGLYARRHNPDIYVKSFRRDQFNGSRINRRRRDLEKFDADDIALIRYGHALDFNGRIHGYPEPNSPPLTVPCTWTVFWIPAYGMGEFRYGVPCHLRDAEQRLLHGAWHFTNHGGARCLGYKYGHLWATRHTGRRLEDLRTFLRRALPDLIEQEVKVVRWNEGVTTCTTAIHRLSPVLGGYSINYDRPGGSDGYVSFSCGSLPYAI